MKGVSLNPHLADAYYNRSLAFRKKKMPAQALEDLTEALWGKRKFSEELRPARKVVIALGRKMDAADDFRKACELGIAAG